MNMFTEVSEKCTASIIRTVHAGCMLVLLSDAADGGNVSVNFCKTTPRHISEHCALLQFFLRVHFYLRPSL
jgi:hypothetical protein